MDLIVFRKIRRPPAEILQQAAELSLATIYEADHETRLMDPGIRSLVSGQQVCGPAVTCRVEPGDNLALHKALAIAEKGDVLVVDGSGCLQVAVWGSIMTQAAQARGLVGIVVDGAVRDVAEIRRLEFPVWARGTCPKGPTKKKFGAVNCPVRVGGVWVQPGDLIVADDDGVGLVRSEDISKIIEPGLERKHRETEFVRKINAGNTTIELMALQSILDQLALTEIESDYQSWMKSGRQGNSGRQ